MVYGVRGVVKVEVNPARLLYMTLTFTLRREANHTLDGLDRKIILFYYYAFMLSQT